MVEIRKQFVRLVAPQSLAVAIRRHRLAQAEFAGADQGVVDSRSQHRHTSELDRTLDERLTVIDLSRDVSDARSVMTTNGIGGVRLDALDPKRRGLLAEKFSPRVTPSKWCLTVIARSSRCMRHPMSTPSLASMVSRQWWRRRLSTAVVVNVADLEGEPRDPKPAQAAELEIEISGGGIGPIMHSNGPQVMSVASPIGSGTWLAPISTGWMAKVAPLVTTMLCSALPGDVLERHVFARNESDRTSARHEGRRR